MEDKILLKVDHLKTFFKTKSGILPAVNGVSFTLKRGEILGVVGESGCGKSTLGRSVLRLFPITGGEILFDGTDISAMNARELKPYRRNMQMVFQNPFSSFNPKQKLGTALREVGKVYGMKEDRLKEKLSQLMEYIGLPEHMLQRHPGELSGGQLQRLAIARALILDPAFIVADEAVSALDVSVQAQILNLITDLRKRLRMTMLFISHEMSVVEHICDQVAVMYLGRIVETAPARELFSDIRHPYTQALMSAIPKADPEERKERIILEGDIPNAIDLPEGCSFASRCRYCTAECKEKRPELKSVGENHLVACHHIEKAKDIRG